MNSLRKGWLKKLLSLISDRCHCSRLFLSQSSDRIQAGLNHPHNLNSNPKYEHHSFTFSHSVRKISAWYLQHFTQVEQKCLGDFYYICFLQNYNCTLNLLEKLDSFAILLINVILQWNKSYKCNILRNWLDNNLGTESCRYIRKTKWNKNNISNTEYIHISEYSIRW